jgi:hypothetical protein
MVALIVTCCMIPTQPRPAQVRTGYMSDGLKRSVRR